MVSRPYVVDEDINLSDLFDSRCDSAVDRIVVTYVYCSVRELARIRRSKFSCNSCQLILRKERP